MENTLTAKDRCDRCSAPALVKVTLQAGPLYLCGHHYHVHADSLPSPEVDMRDWRTPATALEPATV